MRSKYLKCLLPRLSPVVLRVAGFHVGVTILFRQKPTRRSEMASQAVLSTSTSERETLTSMACLHLLPFKFSEAGIKRGVSELSVCLARNITVSPQGILRRLMERIDSAWGT